ncbi:hypothetical protein MKX01_042785 [Papaver californicum]|nr:hypothetical protein MKX01_042785 [Papaver californicum]
MSSFQDLEAGGTFTSKRRDNVNGKQHPIQAVALGVFRINTSLSTFKRLAINLGTPKDTPQLRQKLHSSRLHIAQLVKDTAAKLKQANDTDQPSTEVSASEKIKAYAKLGKDFVSVLKEFQKAKHFAAEREVQYTPSVPHSVPSSYTPSELNRSLDKNLEQRTALTKSKRQDVLQLENEIVFNEAIIEEREQGIQEIQNEIGEIHEIFKDLAVLVHEQGDVILDIDSHVQNSHTATQQAESQLEKAAKTQKSNSSMTCLLWVIFGLVLLIVIIVLTA